MSGSTDILVNNGYRPTISSLRPHVINHFQQTTIKKSQSFNRPLKINEIQGLTKNQHTFARPSNDDSRTTIRNHVQFALPIEETTPTNLNSSNNSFSVTPTNNNNSSINKISEFKNLNCVNANPSPIRNNHQTSTLNNVPLKNITSIRSTSFRTSKNSVPTSTIKYEPSKAFQSSNYSNNNMTTSSSSLHKNEFSKARNTKSFESLNTVKPGDLKLIDEKLNLDVNTHNIHRLIKMATNWNNTNKSRAELAASKNSKIADRSLISQTKIRQTQMFLNDENKMDSESSLSRKMAEVTERSIKVTTHHTLDEAFADAMSDKSIRVFNSNRTPVPNRILPISVNRLSNDLAKKSVASIIDTNEFSSSNQGKHGGGTYWSSNSNVTSEIGENTVGSSAKESSISSYLSKNAKAIKFLHINKGSLNSSFKTNNSRLPIQIQ